MSAPSMNLEKKNALIKRIDMMIGDMESLKIDIKKSFEDEDKSSHPPLFFYDLETSGIGKKTDNVYIRQIGVIAVVNGERSSFYRVVGSGSIAIVETVTETSTEASTETITKTETTTKDLKIKHESSIIGDRLNALGVESFKTVGKDLLSFIGKILNGYTGRFYLLAHNGKSYDSRILTFEMMRNGLALPDAASFVDTKDVFGNAIKKGLNKKIINIKLPSLYRTIVGKTYEEHHDALADTTTLVTITDFLIVRLGISMQEFFDNYIVQEAETIAMARNRMIKG